MNLSGRTYVLGGIIKDLILKQTNEVCSFVASSDGSRSIVPTTMKTTAPRQLLIGISVAAKDNAIVIMGGSAVCFSFGTFWNKGCTTLQISEIPLGISHQHTESPKVAWQYLGSLDTPLSTGDETKPPGATGGSTILVPRKQVGSPVDFDQVLRANEPAVLRGLDMGPCTQKVCTCPFLEPSFLLQAVRLLAIYCIC